METYTFLNAQQITEQDAQEILALLEDQFDTKNDPEQMAINDDSRLWIQTKLPDCATLIKHHHTVVGSTFIMPCTQAVMNDFIHAKITEAELASRMQSEDISYSRMQAIYLCSAFIKAAYRGHGLALSAIVNTIQKITPPNKPITLFCWPYTDEGQRLAEKIAIVTHLPILYRTSKTALKSDDHNLTQKS